MFEELDQRPAVWTGHIFLASADVPATARFFERLGMRSVVVDESFAALELRGGTHLAILHDPGPIVPETLPWDLMVEDIDATHDKWQAEGFLVSDVIKEENIPHRRFEVTDPDGNILVVRDNHVVGPV